MRITAMSLVLAAPAVLAACQGPRQVDAAPPTVTYSYQSEYELRQIEARADRYCAENYGLRAYPVDRRRVSGGYEATFACE